MKYYLNAIRNYANFKGRARRSEYWYFALFNVLFAIAAILIDNALNTTFYMGENYPFRYGLVYLLYALFALLPGLAVLVRRLHDTGKSGWFFFICLIPLVGPIWLLVLLFTNSMYGDNRYGPNPKGLGSLDDIDRIGEDITPS